MTRKASSLRARLAALARALRDLLVTDLDARRALAATVEQIALAVRERDARARVSLRLVAEVLRTDRDFRERQGALQDAAAALAEVLITFLATRDNDERLQLLEAPERAVLALLRQLPVNAPTLSPRASDYVPEGTPAPDRRAGGGAARRGARAGEQVDREFVVEFLHEAREHLEHAETALLALERDPRNADAGRAVLRAFHSIKGTAGFLELDAVVSLAHHTEAMLDHALASGAAAVANAAALALRVLDGMLELLRAIEASLAGAPLELPGSHAKLLAELEGASGGTSTPRAAEVASTEGLGVDARRESNGRDAARADELTTRVRTDRLDRLLDLLGELVVAQWMIVQDDAVRADPHSELAKKVAYAAKLGRELHEMGVGMRLVPIRGACRRLARVARDVALRANKRVQWVAEGEQTELDRNVVELLGDSLVHMVRNAVDHGLEPLAERRALGKPETGTVRLRASQAERFVVIELSDDGRGLQPALIRERARALGLIRGDEMLSEAEILDLIFAPGMTTAREVTDVSGRGVGMDVVRRNVLALRGRIEVHSTPGQGTTFTLRVPLTLAITDGMLVRVGAERYVVPTTNIVLSFRPERTALATVVAKGEVVKLRHELLPVVRLHRLFDVPHAVEDPAEGVLMVVAAGEHRAALLVDTILGQQQLVAKPVGEGVGDVTGVGGAAVLGDGRVGLVLDLAALLEPLPRHAAIDTQAVA